MRSVEDAGFIRIRGAREGKLQQLDLDIPLNAVGCIVGRSGSGHLDLVERVLYGESRARFLRTLRPFEREGIAGGLRVDVDEISGLPPVVNLMHSRSDSRETLGSCTAIEYRFAPIFLSNATWVCPECGGACAAFRPEEVEAAVVERLGLARVLVLAPLPEGAIDEEGEIWQSLLQAGFVRVRVAGKICRLESAAVDWVGQPVEVVVDRLVPGQQDSRRFLEAVRTARSISRGRTLIVDESERLWPFHQAVTCFSCQHILGEFTPERLMTPGPFDGVLLWKETSWAQLKGETVGFLREMLEDRHTSANGAEALRETLDILSALGLDHLPLTRRIQELSHSEDQRLRLALCLAANMAGIVYLFRGLISCVEASLRNAIIRGVETLVEQGNTVLLVDSSYEAQRLACCVWEFVAGSATISSAPIDALEAEPFSGTEKGIRWRINGEGDWGVVDLSFPPGSILGIVGEAGSGKTRLLADVIEPLLRGKGKPYNALWGTGKPRIFTFRRPVGEEPLIHLLGIDKLVADLYAATPSGVERGFPHDFYRLDKMGGRCPTCAGRGMVDFSDDFAEDLAGTCPACAGRRFREDVINITHRGQSIADVMDMTVDAAYAHFARERLISTRLSWLKERDLGYLSLGAPISELNEVEAVLAQWAISLRGKRTDRDVFLIDWFSGGVHPADVDIFVREFRDVARAGGTVWVADGHPQIRSVCSVLLEIKWVAGRRVLRSGP